MAKFKPKMFEIEAIRYNGDAASMLDIADLVQNRASKIVQDYFQGKPVLIIDFLTEEIAIKQGEWLVKTHNGVLSPTTDEDLRMAFDEVTG